MQQPMAQATEMVSKDILQQGNNTSTDIHIESQLVQQVNNDANCLRHQRNLPKGPIVISQTWFGPSTRFTAWSTFQASEHFGIVIANIILMFFPSNFHNGAIKSIWMADGVIATLAQALIGTT